MKRWIAVCLAWLLVLTMTGCGRTMNDVIAENTNAESRICHVSLEVEHKDSGTHFSVGDEVAVYYNGVIEESDPAQIRTVYAILLTQPASREGENRS